MITSRSVVELTAPALPDLEQSPPWERVRDRMFGRNQPEAFEACQFVFESPLIPLRDPFKSYAAISLPRAVLF